MAKPKGSSKPKTSIFLCCFGSSSHANMESSSPTNGSDPISKIKKKKKKTTSTSSWFSWQRIRFNKNSAYKTVPLDVHYSKSKSKSTLHHKPQAPAANLPPPPPPPQPAPVHPATPYYTPTQTRHGANNVEDTRQQGRASPAHAKRQARRLSSSMQTQFQTTPKKAKNSYDPVVGMSVLVVTLVIMIFWGRLCAILCTSVWLYCTPRFRRSGAVNDEEDPQTTKSKEVDLDSEEYKKKVIMEGLLGRNHRA